MRRAVGMIASVALLGCVVPVSDGAGGWIAPASPTVG